MKVLGERVHVPDVLADGTDLRPYKRLAVAVLEAALIDAKGKPNSLQAIDARRFLSGNSPLLEHWCRLIGVHPEKVRELANGRKDSARRSGPEQPLRLVHSRGRPRVRRSRRPAKRQRRA
jgi:hypothetical protein